MKYFNIVHISLTPLVAAPGKMAKLQREFGHNACCIVLNDYPSKGPLANKFLDDSILFTKEMTPFIENSIRQADIIHIHNNCPIDKAQLINRLNQKTKFIYHVHSPLREGPLFLDRTQDMGIVFDDFLVVGQHWPKLYPNYKPVPNIIFHTPSINLRQKGEKLRIAYSPTHQHIGKWTSKHCQELNDTINSLSSLGLIELIRPESPVHPNTLMYMRRYCHLTIDEIATGGYHQVSLEGLCAGNIVINGADYFGKKVLANFCENVDPPFIHAHSSNIAEVITRFVQSEELTREWQTKSLEYFQKYLLPSRLIHIYNSIYEKLYEN
ncbi:hypothetical protein QSV37_18285 [Acinetobacter sp. VNK23]|uniref:hypothetical protein n=1 Tax=Acinetobacter thutiue TaxID=2998078 RepID=UPI002575FEE2|nr:hypothetical protein [Acinetobacter thutiue]MDM1022219.1 hypothetical protein [Acinetobacter thutiue]